jgi:excisionase family DNA binding protein
VPAIAKPPATKQEFISEVDAAEILGLPVRTLQQWRHERRVLKYTKLGRLVRYRLTDIQKHIEQNTMTVDA